MKMTGQPLGVRGFTLIELMIVIVVVAILMAIAVPSYNDSVRKGRRGQAKADLLEIAQLAERFHTVNNTYSGFTLATTSSPSQGTANYTLALGNLGTDTMQVTATATGDQAKDKCGNLSINQSGVKTASGGSVGVCW